MVANGRGRVLGKIAAGLEEALRRRAAAGAPGRTTSHLLARGEGGWVEDVICTPGPGDRPFDERHAEVAIGVVVAGTFAYRSPWGRGLMTPGSWLLGNAGDLFECSHEHAALGPVDLLGNVAGPIQVGPAQVMGFEDLDVHPLGGSNLNRPGD